MTDPTPCQIEGFPLGPFETNCYIVYRQDQPECWIVDAGFDPAPMAARIDQLGLKPTHLILTHAHADHIAGVDEMLARYPACKLLIHEAEKDWLTNSALNLSAGMGMPITTRPADGFIADGDTLTLGPCPWQIFHTPGHSPGGITLYCKSAAAALVGDALFAGSIGRTDFPTSNFETLAESIRTRLYTLPTDTRIHPGHGPATTIGREKLSNPFVRE